MEGHGSLASMPRPLNARQALEQERADLLRQIAVYQQELEDAPVKSKARRERLDRRDRLQWQIERDQKRLAEVEAKLAGS